MKKTNKLVALLLAAVMVLGLMPTVAPHAHAHTHAVAPTGIEEYPVLNADTQTTVTIANAGDVAYFTFTPEKTDLYYYYSITLDAYVDTKGSIYDADMGLLNYNDDSYHGGTLGIYGPNFCMEQVMEAGTTYVLSAQPYQSSWTGDFAVMVMTGHSYTSEVTKEATCTEDGILTYTCQYCGESYEEVIPAAHSYSDEDGKCIHCGETYLVTGTCGENLTWELDWFGKLTIKGTGDMYHYSVSYSDNYPAPWYNDYANAITSLVVEEGVTSIGNYAFYNCQSMTEVSLPTTLTALGSNSFASCYGLTEITLPDAITTIPESCFKYCGSLTTINWPANLTAVANNAFYSCALGDLIVPEGVTTIGQYAFSSNGSMTKLTLPSTLTTLEDYAFASMWNTKDFVFTGDAPTFGGSGVFYYVNANAWYPLGNETWTDEVKQSYGGTITWSGLCTGAHTWGEVVTVPATCETGSYMTMTCTVCGYTEISPENDDALGHDYQYEHYQGSCGDYSYDITTCSRCDYYATENWVWTDHTYVDTTVEATCEIGGYNVHTCSVCGYYYESDWTAPLGHEVAEWSEPSEATCTEDGIKTGHCARCDLDVSEVVTPALGHEWNMEAGVENTDGTITYPCTRCDATYTTEGVYLYLGDNQFTIEGNTGRKTKTYTAAEAGKLTITMNNMVYHNAYAWENGWADQYWQTLAIDWAFSEGFFNVYINDVNTAYTVEGIETEANIIFTTIEVAAGDVVTVEVNHLESTSYYYSNDVQFNMNLALEAAHTHSYEAVVTEPTCTEGGYTTYTCSCGDSYVADETAALGHDYVAEIVPPTCTKSGYTVYTCSRCGHSYKDDPVEPEHQFDEGTVIEPTCTEMGCTVYTCLACGFKYEQEGTYVDALGHDYINGACSRCDAVLESSFADVPAGEFYFDPVKWAVEKGITNGATENAFNPNGELQRAQVVVMLWRAAGEPEPTTTVNPFTDVTEKDWYYNAVLWAVEKGITTGATENTFNPFGVTNRAQAVTFLWRYLEQPASTGSNSFTDVEAGLWYEAPINWAVENGVTNGMGDGTFGINNPCNRAHAVTFLYRALAD